MQKILITGASGSIGRRLIQNLVSRNDEVIVFTQNAQQAQLKLSGVKDIIKWDYNKPAEWKEHLNGVDAVVHLAGANLGAKRWNEEYKKFAYDSRIISTRNLVEAIKSVERKPKVFICASAVGIYSNRYNEILDETSEPGNDFLANLCKDWEKGAEKVEQFDVRRVSIRTGLVLDNYDGLIKKLLPTFKLFLGGYLESGRQWFPWIHIDDIIGIYLHAIDNQNLSGAVNAASPGIVTNKEFSKTLGKILNRPALFPIPKLALRFISGELGNYITHSQRISVHKILKSGYKFKFENLEAALRELMK
jgi:uncharacterized protein